MVVKDPCSHPYHPCLGGVDQQSATWRPNQIPKFSRCGNIICCIPQKFDLKNFLTVILARLYKIKFKFSIVCLWKTLQIEPLYIFVKSNCEQPSHSMSVENVPN